MELLLWGTGERGRSFPVTGPCLAAQGMNEMVCVSGVSEDLVRHVKRKEGKQEGWVMQPIHGKTGIRTSSPAAQTGALSSDQLLLMLKKLLLLTGTCLFLMGLSCLADQSSVHRCSEGLVQG